MGRSWGKESGDPREARLREVNALNLLEVLQELDQMCNQALIWSTT